MSVKDDVGPAFPHDEKNGDGSHYHSHMGMTLRDWFAGQALVAIVGNNQLLNDLEKAMPEARMNDMISKASYMLSDAMLAERSK